MTEQGAASLEIERKYEMIGASALPGADVWAATGLRAGEPRRVELHASYFDTEDRALATARLAMRRRAGGADEGWHLKERTPGGVHELHWPLSDELPEGLRAELRSRIGDAADRVVPAATLETVRVTVRLAESGADAVELADDTVLATDHRAGVSRLWREWEAELVGGADPAVLDRVEPLLAAAGAVPSPSEAKIARATGRLIDLAIAHDGSARLLEALAVMDAADRLAATLRRDGTEALGDPRVAELRARAQALLTVPAAAHE
ncbi:MULTISPECIES: CYTH domain-containing protein [unclassified Leucobacter]|uniref:CYTH domain-containing protein n=1 Tax=unclassified Leucobacter TaxID=2621730 RepID=UPI00069999AE|nr:CYTH domain-containing protein [Leucobacter sp. Ag1]